MVAPGQALGTYTLLDRLGGGGMGEVWIAHHPGLDRYCAAKIIRTGRMADEPTTSAMLAKRFAREAKATSRLSSPHTVKVFDFGTLDDGSFYYVMELLDGLDLRTLVERHGPVAPARAVHFLRQACESLAEAHRAGLVHRDVKPANLFVSEVGIRSDFLKVLDFGLVKSLDGYGEDTQLTTVGAATGSPAFMAPEIVLAEDVGPRADLYALGCVAFWLLTGRLVFEERSAIRMLMAHAERPPDAPSRVAPGASWPAELDALVLDCLAKDPAARPPSAEHLTERLAALPLGPWTDAQAAAWWAAYAQQPNAARAIATAHADTLESLDTEPNGPPAMVRPPDKVSPAPPAPPAPAPAPTAAPPIAEPARVAVTSAITPILEVQPVAGGALVPAPPLTARPVVDPAPTTPRTAPASRDPAGAADLAASRVPRPLKAPVEAEREEAVVRLQNAFGEGDLTLSEYDERLELAARARDALEIAAVTRDLPEHAGPSAAHTSAPAPAVVPAADLAPAIPARRSRRLLAIFSGVARKGAWEVPEMLKVGAIFGSVELDLREARFTAPVTEIKIVAAFGGVEIRVPPGVLVENTGTGIFGAFDEGRPPADPERPAHIVRVSGVAVFGGVSISYSAPRESKPARIGRRK